MHALRICMTFYFTASTPVSQITERKTTIPRRKSARRQITVCTNLKGKQIFIPNMKTQRINEFLGSCYKTTEYETRSLKFSFQIISHNKTLIKNRSFVKRLKLETAVNHNKCLKQIKLPISL